MKTIVVDNNENIRLDSYIVTKEDLSRAMVQKLLEGNNILVNGSIKKSSYKVKMGDKIDITRCRYYSCK